MKKFDVYDSFNALIPVSWRQTMLTGIGLIMFGIFVIAVPAILVILVASFFITAGIVCLYYARHIRQINKDYHETVRVTADDIF